MDDYIDSLILAGALEVNGVDSETGMFTYAFTDKAKEIAPDLYELTQQAFQDMVKVLWSKGFLSMDITESNPMVKVTELALNEDAVSLLNFDERETLRSIIRVMNETEV